MKLLELTKIGGRDMVLLGRKYVPLNELKGDYEILYEGKYSSLKDLLFFIFNFPPKANQPWAGFFSS